MESTHAEGSWAGWTRCGEEQPGPYTDHPTCMLCIGGPDEAGDIRKILEMNSVKDLQRMEDQKYIDAVNATIAKNKP